VNALWTGPADPPTPVWQRDDILFRRASMYADRSHRAAGIPLALRDGTFTPAGQAAYAAVAFADDVEHWSDFEDACWLLGETLLVHSTPCLEQIARGRNVPLRAARELAEDMRDAEEW
jgi:hypothetical protein